MNSDQQTPQAYIDRPNRRLIANSIRYFDWITGGAMVCILIVGLSNLVENKILFSLSLIGILSILLLVKNLIAATTLVGCVDTPEHGAKVWFDAMLNLDGNRILERTCLDQRAAVQEFGAVNTNYRIVATIVFGCRYQIKC